MRHVPLAAFKDKASEYIAAAEKGEEIIITRHGKPAAKLVTAIDRGERKERARAAWERLMRHREMIAWKNEGRP